MSHVIEINDVDELSAYRLLWESLQAQTPDASFFLTLDWLLAYWRHFGAAQTMRVLVVHAGRKPIGIMPLTIRVEPTRAGRIRVLTYPLHDWGSFYGPIGPDPTATLTVVMKHIRRTPRDWDLLDLRWIHKAHLRRRTSTAMAIAGYPVRESVWKETAIVDTQCTWGEYLQRRTPKFRATVRARLNRISRFGHVQHVRYRPRGARYGDEDPRWDLYEECVQIARRSWQGQSSGGTTLSTESVRAFFREVHALAAKHGSLDVNLLRVDHRPAAFCYNYHHDGKLYGVRAGYDPDFAPASVGAVLQAMQLRDSMRRGDQFLDMGHGSMDTKRPWLTRVVTSYRCTHYPARLRPQLLRLKHVIATADASGVARHGEATRSVGYRTTP